MKGKKSEQKYFVKFGLEFLSLIISWKKSHSAKFLYKQKFKSQKSQAKDCEIENLENKYFETKFQDKKS